MLKLDTNEENIDGQLAVTTKEVIERYMESAQDFRDKGNHHLCFVYEAQAEGAYRLWIEMTSPTAYGKYGAQLLTSLGR